MSHHLSPRLKDSRICDSQEQAFLGTVARAVVPALRRLKQEDELFEPKSSKPAWDNTVTPCVWGKKRGKNWEKNRDQHSLTLLVKDELIHIHIHCNIIYNIIK